MRSKVTVVFNNNRGTHNSNCDQECINQFLGGTSSGMKTIFVLPAALESDDYEESFERHYGDVFRSNGTICKLAIKIYLLIA